MVKTSILLSSALALVLVLNTATQAGKPSNHERLPIERAHARSKNPLSFPRGDEGDYIAPVDRRNVEKSSVGAGARRKLNIGEINTNNITLNISRVTLPKVNTEDFFRELEEDLAAADREAENRAAAE